MSEQSEIRISEAEWRLMEALWESGELAPAQIIKQLEGSTDWNHRTIRSLLSRLVSKGAVSRSKETGTNLYRAEVSREECIRKESDSFVNRVFQGDVRSLLDHFDAAPAAKAKKRGRGVGTKALGQVIDTFFGGSVEDAFAAHLGRGEKLEPEELERLSALIEEAKNKGN